MPNLSGLSQVATAATALSNLVLVTPRQTVGYQPQNPPNENSNQDLLQQPPTFLFHFERDQDVTLESDITDNYVEDNISNQDHIALKPELYTTRGYIGELNDIVPAWLSVPKAIVDKLTAVQPFEPQLTLTAQLAYQNAFFAHQVAVNTKNAAVSAWSTLTGDRPGTNVIGDNGLGGQVQLDTGTVQGMQNKQQSAFQLLYGYWFNRYLFTIQTPWAVFTDMAILRLKAVQSGETRMISDFEVTFKKIRKAKTALINLDNSSLDLMQGQGRYNQMTSPGTNLGTSSAVASSPLSSRLGVA